MSKPKDAAHKRNNVEIRYRLRQSIFKALVDRHQAGGALSMLDDLQLAELADLVTSSVMHIETLTISVKRSRTP